MTDTPHVLDYHATLDRMEPGIAPVDIQISVASIAISLVKINRSLESIHIACLNLQETSRMASGNIVSVSSSVNGISNNLSYVANTLADLAMAIKQK